MKASAHRIVTTLAITSVLGAAGCGGGSDHGGGERRASGSTGDTRTTATTTSTARSSPSTSVDPETSWKPTNGGTLADAATTDEVRLLGGRFINAMVRHSEPEFCAALAPGTRDALARNAGSCEAFAARLFPQADTAWYAGARVLEVRLLDGYAYASIEGQDGDVATGEDGIVARRVSGHWRATLPSIDPSPPPHLSRADVGEIRATTARYLDALKTGRWSVACAARTPEGRSLLARAGDGRCENAVKAAATGNGVLGSLRAGKVALVDDGRATVEIQQGGNNGYEDLDVHRVGGRWLLADADDGTYGNTYDLP